jgi:hypothetical protein
MWSTRRKREVNRNGMGQAEAVYPAKVQVEAWDGVG